jgi:pyridinium-3,5-biscarboxylic acid mononucleotide synthase
MSNNHCLDLDRSDRLGFPETVFGERKDKETLADIAKNLVEANGSAFITRLQPDKAAHLKNIFANIDYDEKSGSCIIGSPRQVDPDFRVAIISGGTSDEFVVNEAFYTLKYLGISSNKFHDVGVAGLQRILNIKNELEGYDALIVVAGFEGALPTVVGGLLPQLIIAVPSSIGYGVAEGGKSALNSMLSSCANGILVVNIDNGYGAALAAFRLINTIRGKVKKFQVLREELNG